MHSTEELEGRQWEKGRAQTEVCQRLGEVIAFLSASNKMRGGRKGNGEKSIAQLGKINKIIK